MSWNLEISLNFSSCLPIHDIRFKYCVYELLIMFFNIIDKLGRGALIIEELHKYSFSCSENTPSELWGIKISELIWDVHFLWKIFKWPSSPFLLI